MKAVQSNIVQTDHYEIDCLYKLVILANLWSRLPLVGTFAGSKKDLGFIRTQP